MNILKQNLLALTAMLSSLIPQTVFAEATTSDAVAATGIGIFFIVVFGIIGLIAVLAFVFWVLMVIHAAQNDIPDKNVWLAILIVSLVVGMPFVGAIVYYFVVKKKLDETLATATKKPKSAKKT